MLLAEEPRHGELDQRPPPPGARRTDDAISTRLPRVSSSWRYSIAPLPTSNTSPGWASRSATRWSGEATTGSRLAHDAPGHGPVDGEEDLAATGVDHRDDPPLRVADGVRERVEAGHARRSARASTCASVFAVCTPTRSPVNRPGPIPTAMPPTWRSSMPLHSSSCFSAGVTASCRARPATAALRDDARTRCRSPRCLGGRGLDPDDDHAATSQGARTALELVRPPGPPRTRGLDLDPPGLVHAGRILARELDPQPVVGEELLDRVAPLDEQHAPRRRRSRRDPGPRRPGRVRAGRRRRARR